MSKAAQYAKFVAALVGQALTFASLYYGTNKWVAAAVAAAAALGVYAVPNQVPNQKPEPPAGPPPPAPPAG